MATPHRETLIQAIVTRLEGITITNGFEQDIERVIRPAENAVQVDERPALVVRELPEVTRRLIRQTYENVMSLEIHVVETEEDDAERMLKLEKIAADVIKRLMADETQSGNCVATTAKISTRAVDEDMKPLSGARIQAEFLYRVERADPFAQRTL